MALSEAPPISLHLTDRAVVQDPVPTLTVARTQPVFYDEDVDRHVVARYSEVRSMMGNADDFSQDVEYLGKIHGGRTIALMDNPDHMVLRRILNPTFSHSSVAAMASVVGRLVDECLDEALERMRDGEAVDFVEDVNGRLAIGVIASMLGVPAQDTDRFSTWANEMLKVTEATAEPDPGRRARLEREGLAATASLHAYAADLLVERRKAENDEDLVGVLACSQGAAEVLSEVDLRANVALFVVAGHDSSQKMLGHLLAALAEHPDQRRAIAADRGLIAQTIDELVRWAVSTPVAPRVARRDVQIGGARIPAGARVLALTGAANRDPDRWDEPDRFDIARASQAHVGFGFGTHTCIGAALARLQLSMLLDAVLDRMPDYTIAAPVEYGPMFMKRGPLALPLVA